MVQPSNPGELRPEEGAGKGKAVVKVEVEDPLEEECEPLHKRSRPSGPFPQDFQQEWSTGAATASSQHAQYNPLDEPSPLGLRLRKSPSLLELIQMKLAQSSAATSGALGNDSVSSGKRDARPANAPGTTEKLKASNFPATLLRIGSWECVSRYEGDLVAKCYFAKHKLVWEVLDGGLKSKIEIQWSDITALKASCPDNGSGTLDVVLSRQPLFFRETNPQPRKHTLWQATSDFTGGQASIHRRHFLKCAPGLLSKHFEKLIQCDPRLYSLSQQPEIAMDSPYFEPRCSIFEDQDDGKPCGLEHMRADHGPSLGFREASSTCSAPSTSSKSDMRELAGRTPESSSRETPSPISGIATPVPEESTSFQVEQLKNPSDWEQFKVPGLHPSMSMSDLVNHIGNCISEKNSSGDPLSLGTPPMNKDMLEEITQYLLSDSHGTGASDEVSLMSRVNSLCCLLQNPTPQNHQKSEDHCTKEDGNEKDSETATEKKPVLELSLGDGESKETKPPSAMSRKESFGDLLLHLPRIASLPQFLFNIPEDS